MTKFYLILVLFSLPFSALAKNCVDQEKNWPAYMGKPVKTFFKAEQRKIKIGREKDKTNVMVFNYRGPAHIASKDQERLYYQTLYRYDHLLMKKRCPASTERVYFLFPQTTMTISTKDLKRIRAERQRPAWEAHALLRSQVVHETI